MKKETSEWMTVAEVLGDIPPPRGNDFNFFAPLLQIL